MLHYDNRGRKKGRKNGVVYPARQIVGPPHARSKLLRVGPVLLRKSDGSHPHSSPEGRSRLMRKKERINRARPTLEETTMTEAAKQFEKHVALIQKQHPGCKEGQARWIAWTEGPSGYAKRLQQE